MEQYHYDPIQPYFSSVYMSLMSVVQGVSLGALFYIMCDSIKNEETLNIYLHMKVGIAFLLICFLWHRYIIHVIYQVWQITFLDTFVPMFFSLIELSLILSIKESVFYYVLFMMAFWTWGFIAYLNVYIQHKKTLPLYEKHFANNDNKFAKTIWKEILLFAKKSLIEAIGLTFIWGLLLTFIYNTSLSEETYTIIISVFFMPVILYLSYFDLSRQLKKKFSAVPS